MKLLDIIEHGASKAYVFDSPIPGKGDLVYEKHGNLYVGRDSKGFFYDTLVYSPDFSVKSFCGDNFVISLNDGTEVCSNGKLLDGGLKAAIAETGVCIEGIIAESLDALRDRYCFRTVKADYGKLSKLISEFYEEHPGYSPKTYWGYKEVLDGKCA